MNQRLEQALDTMGWRLQDTERRLNWNINENDWLHQVLIVEQKVVMGLENLR